MFLIIAGVLVALVIIAYSCVLASSRRSRNRKIEQSIDSKPFRCGTPHLQNGGTLICQTGDIIEIVTREGTETMTVSEYEARKAKC
jgi:hypothetical protein